MPSLDRRVAVIAVVLAATVAPAAQSSTTTAQAAYAAAVEREEVLRRDLDGQPRHVGDEASLLRRLRSLVDEYETLARRFPQTGSGDQALYRAALLSAHAYWHFGDDEARTAALRLFNGVRTQYPKSSLTSQISAHIKRLEAPRLTASEAPSPPQSPAASSPRPASPPSQQAGPAKAGSYENAATPNVPSPPPSSRGDQRPALKAIRRDALQDALRITLELERETTFHDERLDGPPRVFIDLHGVRAGDDLKDATLIFAEDVVRQIRVGRQSSATRVVMDLQGAARHSVYALYDPYRIVIDFERETTAVAARDVRPQPAPAPESRAIPGASWVPERPAAVEATLTPPSAPSSNSRGGFSISRQLGLGISRVVIDAGHGGHDPGARVKGLTEADLVLDVALRLEKLLLKQPGVEVVLTRRTNVFVPLDERTAIANRSAADLFLSIHANAAENTRLRGIETYFLNFAPNPEAEAIAARENAGSAKTMFNLPDIVKAITLNNKIDESRDFASQVQAAMYARLRRANRDLRNLGVKQAPFMVLIGATMPSVLAEISFVTNRHEASLLKTQNYRQAIAEALLAGVSKYQKSLKSAQTVAAQ